jgi:hypothetical protein
VTRAEAQALAAARWNKIGHADSREDVHGHVAVGDDRGYNDHYEVGWSEYSGIHIVGCGGSWSQACERAGLITEAADAGRRPISNTGRVS